MANPQDLKVKLSVDASGVTSGVNEATAKLKSFGSSAEAANVPFSNLGKTLRSGLGMLGLAVGIQQVTQAMGGAIKAASDLNETQTATDAVFGAASTQLKEYAKTTSATMGQSQRQFLDAAKTFGIFGKAAGLANEDNAKFSTGLTKLATDLASFNNTSVDDAINALGAGLRGESEPLRRFGVLLDDATLKSEAMKLKIYSGSGALTQQQKVLAAHAAILDQTKTQQGDFARTSDGLANSQRSLTAVMEDASAQIGTALAPAMTQFVKAMVPLAQEYAPKLGEALSKMPWKAMADGLAKSLDFILKNAEAIKNFAIMVGAAVTGWKLYKTAATIAKDAQILLNVAMSANPVGLLVAGIAALVGWLIVAKGAYDNAATSAGKLAKAKADKEYAKSLADKSGVGAIATKFWGNQSGATREAGMAAADSAAAKRAADAAKAAKLAGGDFNVPDLTGAGSDSKAQTKAQKNLATVMAYLKTVQTKVKNAQTKFDDDQAAAYEKYNSRIADLTDARNSALEYAQANYDDKIGSLTENRDTALVDAAEAYKDKIKNITESRDEALLNAQSNFNDKVASLTATRDEALVNAAENHAQKLTNIQASYADKLANIIQQSMDRLRNAFAQATSIDVGSIFKDLTKNGAASADALIEELKTRLAKAKGLAQDAASLSSAGFSQAFIEQVVAQGPDAGDAMAKSLLAATPEAQAQLQSLFDQTQATSNTGMDALSKQIYDKSGLATTALKSLYSKTQADLADALTAENDSYAEQVAKIQSTFTKGMAEAQKSYDDAVTKINNTFTKGMADAQSAYADAVTKINSTFNKGVADAQEAHDKAVKKINDTFTKGVADAEDALTKSLADSADALNKSLDSIDAAMTAKLLSLKGKLAGAGAEIAATRDLINNAQVGANANPYAGLTAAQQAFALQSNSAGPDMTVINNIQPITTADPQAIAVAMTNASKMNAPYIMPASMTGTGSARVVAL